MSHLYATADNLPNSKSNTMCKPVSVNAQRLLKTPWWHFWKKQNATPRRPTGGTHKDASENFRSMKLLKKKLIVDADGHWWSVETRQDHATGLILKETRRISTTAGYLKLVGDSSLKDSRRYFAQEEKPEVQATGADVGAIIKAYATTPGVTPEDVARFAKELMT